MAVYVDSITFTNNLDNTPVNWLLANLGDEITIQHNISVKEFTLSSSSAPFTLNNQDGYLPVSGSAWITGADFSKFEVGDNCQFTNYTTSSAIHSMTIVEKLSSTEIRVSPFPIGWTPNLTTAVDVISIVTPVTALLYKWNFIENAEATNYLSKVDGTSQLAQITGLNASAGGTNKLMTFIGGLEYQIGSITVDEVSITNNPVYTSKFIIKHVTRVTPTMLSAQWDDLLAGIKPDYFFNLNCLKAVFNYDARYFLTDPNHLQKLELDTILGNSGWFNENWNTNLTKYYKENLTYTDVATSTIVPRVQLKETNFEFFIRNTIDAPFVAGSTSLILNFAKAPYDESEYQLNGRDLKHNFVWETAKIKAEIAPTAVNGSNYADLSLRSLSNLKATFISSSSIKVTGKFTYDTLGINVFEESEEPRYMFWVSIQDHTKVGALADRVNIKIDFNSFYYKTEFPSLITMSSKLIPHDYSDSFTTAFPDRQKFAEDELTAYTAINVLGDEDVTSVQLLRYTSKIQAYNSVTFETFDLESKTITLPLTPVYFGFQSFNIIQAKPSIHVPAGEIIKNILARNLTSYGAYEFAYPFLIRWEYWKELLIGNSFFFNSAQPNNGINHDWQHYFTGAWKLRYVFELGTKINGVPAIYTNSVDFDAYDRNLPSENTTCVIETYDTSGTLLIDTSGKKYILGYENTKVKAIFTNGIDTFTGLSDNIEVVIGIEIFEQGGVNGKRRMSSKFVSDADTWFIPLSGETKVKLTATSTTLVAETQIDFTKISSLVANNKWKITARVYGSAVSSSHGTILNGQNYLGSQDVYMIATNPVDEPTTVIEPKEMDCCSDFIWRVLADLKSDSELRNDKTSFLWWFNKDAIERAKLFLLKPDGSSVLLESSTTYGTPYNYGFKINGNNEKLIGYLLNWKNILTAFGEGVYQVKCQYKTIFGASKDIYSKSYCLKQYTDFRANGTVRIEYTLNGLLGVAENDEKLRDVLDLNWYNQHRFDGVFHYNNSTYTSDEIQYQNGQLVTVEDEQTAEYLLKLKSIPNFKHDILRLDILMADEILITDYNDSNIDGYFKKKVRKNGSYDPKWYPLASKLASIELKFKQAFNNLKKFRT